MLFVLLRPWTWTDPFSTRSRSQWRPSTRPVWVRDAVSCQSVTNYKCRASLWVSLPVCGNYLASDAEYPNKRTQFLWFQLHSGQCAHSARQQPHTAGGSVIRQWSLTSKHSCRASSCPSMLRETPTSTLPQRSEAVFHTVSRYTTSECYSALL